MPTLTPVDHNPFADNAPTLTPVDHDPFADGPTMQAYNPTWRDRLAAMMMGDEKASPERRRLVEGLTGSSGLGSTGMGVIDLTPAGIPLAGQEARRDAQEGNWSGAALNAMAMIPALKPEVAAARAAGNEVAQGFRAYHGSPHSFDSFDLGKVGTGEGAQSHGVGVYLTDDEGKAITYKNPAGRWGDQSAMQRYHEMGPGSTYEVQVNAPQTAFLDWQSPVKNLPPGSNLAQRLESKAAKMDPEDAALIREHGRIHHIWGDGAEADARADGFAGTLRRSADGGTDYSVFDPGILQILRKYGVAGLLGGGAANQLIPSYGPDQEPQNKLVGGL